MVVIAIIAILAALLLPALTRAKLKAQGIQCMNNLRQLQMSWFMYVQDNGDCLPGVSGGGYAGSNTWVSGWLDFDNNNTDNTNTLYLTDARYSQIGPYVKSPAVYRCPADHSMALFGSQLLPRVRSMSMNCWMNYIFNVDIGQDQYIIFRKYTDIQRPPPSMAWVLIDEREDSINDGLFQTDLVDRGASARIVDYPASYHGHAAGILFADGHAEIKRWVDARTTPPLNLDGLIPLTSPRPTTRTWRGSRIAAAARSKRWLLDWPNLQPCFRSPTLKSAISKPRPKGSKPRSRSAKRASVRNSSPPWMKCLNIANWSK